MIYIVREQRAQARETASSLSPSGLINCYRVARVLSDEITSGIVFTHQRRAAVTRPHQPERVSNLAYQTASTIAGVNDFEVETFRDLDELVAECRTLLLEDEAEDALVVWRHDEVGELVQRLAAGLVSRRRPPRVSGGAAHFEPDAYAGCIVVQRDGTVTANHSLIKPCVDDETAREHIRKMRAQDEEGESDDPPNDEDDESEEADEDESDDDEDDEDDDDESDEDESDEEEEEVKEIEEKRRARHVFKRHGKPTPKKPPQTPSKPTAKKPPSSKPAPKKQQQHQQQQNQQQPKPPPPGKPAPKQQHAPPTKGTRKARRQPFERGPAAAYANADADASGAAEGGCALM